MAKKLSVCYCNPYVFAKETVKPSKVNKEEAREGTVEGLIQYLVTRHCIRVPEDFSNQLTLSNQKFRITELNMSFKTIDGIIKSCNMWKPYIAEEDFDKLVCGELLSMAGIHTSVLSARNFEEQQNLQFTNKPSPSFVTIVDYSGRLTVYR